MAKGKGQGLPKGEATKALACREGAMVERGSNKDLNNCNNFRPQYISRSDLERLILICLELILDLHIHWVDPGKGGPNDIRPDGALSDEMNTKW